MFAKGSCEVKFLHIQEAFNDLFKNNKETGAAFSVVQNNRKIISLHGGTKNLQKDPWDENTIVNTFSASKGMYEACIAKSLMIIC